MLSLLKTFLPLPLLLAFVTSAAAQPVREHDVGARALAFHGKVNLKAPTYEASAEARKVVQRIMGAIGLAANFEVRAAPDVDYAQAVVDNGGKTRLVLYNPTWMDGLSATLGDTWPKVSVLAHEIGHHLQFHMHADFANHEAELQADKFSGHILRKLGASLEQALLPMAYIGEVLETDTHPRRSLRIAAITQGWREADAGEGANVIKAVIKPSPAVAAGPRVALLIGNTNYKVAAPLKNPKNDVIAIQRELRKLGFSTTTLYDGTNEQIADYVRLFRAEAKDADWAVFYFAGQGIEVDGVNYMVPIDANAELPTFTRDYPNMRLETAFEAVREARIVRLVVANSCRVDPANPPDAFNRVEPSRVFKVIEPPRGIVVAYSTRAGRYAQDGDEDLSPYAQAFIKALREPGIELDRVFRRVNAEVFQITKGIQEPSVLGTWPAEELHLAVR